MNRKIRTSLYLLTVLLVLSLLHPLTSFTQESPVQMYWLAHFAGAVQRANLDGSGVEELLSGLKNPLGIALSLPQTTEQATAPEELIADINGDGVINIQDLVIVATSFGATGENAADVNGDGVVNIQDLVQVAGALGEAAAPPSAHAEVLTHLTGNEVKQWLRAAQQANLVDPTFQRGLETLKHLLTVLIPKETVLLANYPNPFNPETWIPYQLANPADVTLRIHAIDGSLVRTLSLGHKGIGIYQIRSRAAYWDGRNEIGEPVASGVYFYTLTAGDFTATRKMLIRK